MYKRQALESQNPVSPVTASTDMENAPNVLDKQKNTVVNYRRYKRKKRIEQMRKNREFKLVDGGRKGAERGSFHVA